MRIFIWLSIMGLVYMACVSCSGKQAMREAIFTGRVTAQDTSVYLAGVKVFEKSHNKLSTTTDSAGYFRLDRVAFEEHNIYFEKEGYEPTVFNFEYNGNLEHPIVTDHIIMKKAGSGE
jgi:hypothetical protein